MAFTKPTDTATFNTAFSGTNTIAPDVTRQNQGWAPGDKPPAQYFNWLQGTYHQWLRYIDERVADLVSDGFQINTPAGSAGELNLLTVDDGTESGNIRIKTGGITGTSTGLLEIATGTNTTGNSGLVLFKSGGAGTVSGPLIIGSGDGPESGTINLSTGVASAGVSGAVEIQTGGSTADSTGAIDVHTGATTSGFSGNVNLYSGDGTAATGGSNVFTGDASTGNSGNLNLFTGTGATTTGQVFIATGNSALGNSGQLLIQTGVTVQGISGDISLSTGDAAENFSGNYSVRTGLGVTSSGNYSVITGNATAGPSGNVTIESGSGTTASGAIQLSSGNAPSGTSGDVDIFTGTSQTPSGDIRIHTGQGTSSGAKQGNLLFWTGTGPTDFNDAGAIAITAGYTVLAGLLDPGDILVSGKSLQSVDDGGDLTLECGNAPQGADGATGRVLILGGETNSTADTNAGILISGGNSSIAGGTDLVGGDVTIAGGRTTGNEGSSIVMQVARAGTTGAIQNSPQDYLVCDGVADQVRSHRGYTNHTGIARTLYQNIFRGYGQNVAPALIGGELGILVPQNDIFYLPLLVPEARLSPVRVKIKEFPPSAAGNLTITVYKIRRNAAAATEETLTNDTTTVALSGTAGTVARESLTLTNTALAISGVGPDDILVLAVSHTATSPIHILGVDIDTATDSAGEHRQNVTYFR